MKASAQIDNRFQSDAGKYAAYLESPEGRLRLDLSFANVQGFLPVPQPNSLLCALDLGGGTGAAAVRLARLGYHVTLVDSSPAMLDIAQRAALDAQVNDKITTKHSDVDQLAGLFDGGSFDLILCHNVLEYVEDPAAVLCAAAKMMKASASASSMLSVLVRNQTGEVLKAAIQSGDLAAANDGLTAEWGKESLYGGKVRLFTVEDLRTLL